MGTDWFVLEDGPDYETDDDPETLALVLQEFEAGDDGTTAPQPSPKKRICVRRAAVSAVQQAVSSAAQPARDSASNVEMSIRGGTAGSAAQPATTLRRICSFVSGRKTRTTIKLLPRGGSGGASHGDGLRLRRRGSPRAI